MSAADSGENSGPDDPGALVEEINRTRAELGDTVEALVSKADVKAQAKQRAAEVSAQAKQRAAEVSQQAKGKLQGLTQQLAGRAGQLSGPAGQTRQAVTANGKTVLGAGAAGGKAVQRGAQRAARAVAPYRVPVVAAAAAGAVLLVSWIAIRRRRR